MVTAQYPEGIREAVATSRVGNAPAAHIAQPATVRLESVSALSFGGLGALATREGGQQSSLIVPSALAYDPISRSAVVLDTAGAKLVFVPLDGSTIGTRPLPVSTASDVLIDAVSGTALVVDQASASVYGVTPNEVRSLAVPSLRQVPRGSRFDFDDSTREVVLADRFSLASVRVADASPVIPAGPSASRPSQASKTPITIIRGNDVAVFSENVDQPLIVGGFGTLIDIRDSARAGDTLWMLVSEREGERVVRNLVRVDLRTGDSQKSRIDISIPGDMTRLLAPISSQAVVILDGTQTEMRIRTAQFA